MNIIEETNKPVNINNVKFESEQLYCVLDYSDPSNPDYYFIPMFFLEQFSSPAAYLKIGDYKIQVPLEWSIIIGEKHLGDLEVVRIDQVLDKDFSAFVFNPINGYQPKFYKIDVMDVYPDILWHVPKLRNGHILSVPLSNKEEPECIFLVKETNKLPDYLEIMKLV